METITEERLAYRPAAAGRVIGVSLVQDSVMALAIACAGIDQGGAPNFRWLYY